jgi:excisionase family DNA binding protein
MPTRKKEQAFHSLGKVAKDLGLSRMTVYRYVIARKLPAYKFGTHYRVRESDIEKFIAKNKI